MEIVIDIPDNEYELLQRGTTIGSGVDADSCLRTYILNGTVLPKGHSDLIDRNVALNLYKPSNVSDKQWSETTLAKSVNNAPTVIPADKGE